MSHFRRIINFSRGSLLRRFLPTAIGGLGIGVVAYIQPDVPSFLNKNLLRQFATIPVMTAEADTKHKCQDMVFHEDKAHGLFLVLHLKNCACPQACAQALQKLNEHIDRISPKDIRDEDTEIIMGLAFGPDFLKKVYPDAMANGVEPFEFNSRKIPSLDMPSTGGDILVHAVCTEQGKLFELVQAVLAEMPAGAVKKVEETYGFVYRNGRDLSGFIDGTENPADEDDRIEVAVNKKTGGSYVLTQRWLHDLKKIASEQQAKMEQYIGRTEADSIEIKPIQVSSHVGRMTHGLSDADAEEKRIVRHSMPYGKVTDDCGLLFIAYSSTPRTLNWMLDRMMGLSPDKSVDGIFQFTKPITGSFFYSPSKAELETILSAKPKRRLW